MRLPPELPVSPRPERHQRHLVIYFYDPTAKRYWPFPYRDITNAPMTAAELHRRKALLRKQAKEDRDERAIFDGRQFQRDKLSESLSNTARSRRRRKPLGATDVSSALNPTETDEHEQSDFESIEPFPTLERHVFDHLDAGARRFLERTDSERIRYPQVPEMIAYPRASEILSALQELFEYQPMHRMPNVLIYGRTSNGKTMIVDHFSKQYPASDDPDKNNSVVPILTVLAPPTPHEGHFLDGIIQSLYAPGKFSYSLGQKRKQVLDLLTALKVKMLIIDEIQHVLAGGPVHQRAFINSLKLTVASR